AQLEATAVPARDDPVRRADLLGARRAAVTRAAAGGRRRDLDRDPPPVRRPGAARTPGHPAAPARRAPARRAQGSSRLTKGLYRRAGTEMDRAADHARRAAAALLRPGVLEGTSILVGWLASQREGESGATAARNLLERSASARAARVPARRRPPRRPRDPRADAVNRVGAPRRHNGRGRSRREHLGQRAGGTRRLPRLARRRVLLGLPAGPAGLA